MRTILVPLDGSAFAELALPLALRAAKRTGARLRLVSAFEGGPPIRGGQGALTFDTRLDADMRAALAGYLDETKRRLALSAPGVETDAVIVNGAAAEAIAWYARTSGAELVVLTTHGRRGLSRVWLGSVADALVRHISVPALVVRPRDGNAPQPDEFGPRQVLIALDGSAASEAAIEPALALEGTDGVEYTLLRVAVPFDPFMLAAVGARHAKRHIRDERAAATAYLDELARRLRGRGLVVHTAVVEHADPAGTIIDHALDVGADVVAMTTHARGPAGRLLLGSVADKVLRAGWTPVLFCHAPADARAASATEETSAVTGLVPAGA